MKEESRGAFVHIIMLVNVFDRFVYFLFALCGNGFRSNWVIINRNGRVGSFRRIRVVSPVGRFAGSFRPESFRPGFMDGSFRPYYVGRFARELFRP